MNYESIHRYDQLTPQHPGKYLIRFFLSGPWIEVYFDGTEWSFLSGDTFHPRIIVLWRILYEGS